MEVLCRRGRIDDLQIALGVDRHPLDALELQADSIGVGAWPNHEVIFQLAAGAVIHQIDAGINRSIAYAPIIRHGAPVLLLRAEKVIGAKGQRIHAGNFRMAIRVQQRDGDGPLVGSQGGAASRQEQAIIASPGGELDAGIPAALIGLEHDGQYGGSAKRLKGQKCKKGQQRKAREDHIDV